MKDLDISNIESKPTTTKRDRIPIERKKYGEIVAERDKYKESAEINGRAAHEMLRDYERVLLDIGKVTAERDRLKAENDELVKDLQLAKAKFKSESIALAHFRANFSTLDSMRHQRDMARFLAAMFFLAAFGFAVAVWIGRLVPVT